MVTVAEAYVQRLRAQGGNFTEQKSYSALAGAVKSMPVKGVSPAPLSPKLMPFGMTPQLSKFIGSLPNPSAFVDMPFTTYGGVTYPQAAEQIRKTTNYVYFPVTKMPTMTNNMPGWDRFWSGFDKFVEDRASSAGQAGANVIEPTLDALKTPMLIAAIGLVAFAFIKN